MKQGHEFIIKEVEDAPGFIDCAGIESPGLTSAPAIGRMAAELAKKILDLQENPTFRGARKGILNPAELPAKERNELIRKNPAYGRIVCRCEMISEGEIFRCHSQTSGSNDYGMESSAERELEWAGVRQAFVHRRQWRFWNGN